MKNYLNFETEVKNIEDELENLKDPYNQSGLSEVDTKKISETASSGFANGIAAFLFRKYQFALSRYAVVRMELAPIRNERLSIRFILLVAFLFGSLFIFILLNFWMRGESKTARVDRVVFTSMRPCYYFSHNGNSSALVL